MTNMCVCVFCGACLRFHKSRISICRLPVYEKFKFYQIFDPEASLLGDFTIQVCMGGVGVSVSVWGGRGGCR